MDIDFLIDRIVFLRTDARLEEWEKEGLMKLGLHMYDNQFEQRNFESTYFEGRMFTKSEMATFGQRKGLYDAGRSLGTDSGCASPRA